jgi:hypothetical protein
MPQIVRITLLKVADAETIQQALQKYSTLTQDAKKVLRYSPRAYPLRQHTSPGNEPACTSRISSQATRRPVQSSAGRPSHGVNPSFAAGPENCGEMASRVDVTARLHRAARKCAPIPITLPANGKHRVTTRDGGLLEIEIVSLD